MWSDNCSNVCAHSLSRDIYDLCFEYKTIVSKVKNALDTNTNFNNDEEATATANNNVLLED